MQLLSAPTRIIYHGDTTLTTVKARYDGKSIIPDATGAEQVRKFKSGLKPGDAIALSFAKAQYSRSRLQQGLAHELLGRYARAMGEPLESVKIKAKADLGYYVWASDVLSGRIPMPSWRGRFVDLAEVYPSRPEGSIVLLRSEASYTTHQEGELIDLVMQMCQHNGVRVQDIVETMQAQHGD